MIQNYKNLKSKGLVDVRAHGSGKVSVVVQNYDTDRTRLDDIVEVRQIESFKSERDALAQDLDQRKMSLADLDAMIADATDADAKFNSSNGEEKRGAQNEAETKAAG